MPVYPPDPHSFALQVLSPVILHALAGHDQGETGVNVKTFEQIWPEVRRRTLLDGLRARVIYDFVGRCGPGDFAEVGVMDGGITAMLALAAPDRIVHAFDTFAGIPSGLQPYESGLWPGRFCAVAGTEEFLRSYRNIRVHRGLFPETAFRAGVASRFALVHLDADTYSATAGALTWFWTRLSGFLVVDDFGRGDAPGVQRAFADLLPSWQEYQWSYDFGLSQLVLEKQ